MTVFKYANALQDTTLPSRKHNDPEYHGLFGKSSAYTPMRLFALTIVLLLVVLTAVVLYYEYAVVRKRRQYHLLNGTVS